MEEERAATESRFLELLNAADPAEEGLLAKLFGGFYEELHGRARRELGRGVPVTLGPTTLLHETFLSIAHRDSLSFPDRQRFLSYAARAMRGLIVDHFRNRRSQKRGGLLAIEALPTEISSIPADEQSEEIVQVGEALEALAGVDPRLAECVDLKFFCGLSFAEIAELREVSERTVQRDWDKARVILSRLLQENRGSGSMPE